MAHEYRITEDDYVAALRLASRRQTWRRFFPWIMVGVALLLSISTYNDPGQSVLFTVSVVVVIGLVALEILGATLIPKRIRSIYRKDKAHHQALAIDMSDAGLHVKSPLQDVTLPWDNMVKWREDENYILVFSSPVMFQIVPKRLAQDGFDIEELRTRLTAATGPAV